VDLYRSKQRKYGPGRSALQHYIREGWAIETLPWVIGIRGLADTANLQMALSFLDTPQRKWRAIIEESVLASVRALAYMHTIRESSINRQLTMDKLPTKWINCWLTHGPAGNDDDLRRKA
jgi:hypothetical protein